jgi:hypothetical protein
MTDISPRATTVTTPFGIPDQYLLGISGVCRVWQDHNGTTQCTHNLFHETDFLALLRTDSNNSALALGNGQLDTDLVHFQWNALNKASSTLIVAATALTAILGLLIQLNNLVNHKILVIVLALNAICAFAAASL